MVPSELFPQQKLLEKKSGTVPSALLSHCNYLLAITTLILYGTI